MRSLCPLACLAACTFTRVDPGAGVDAVPPDTGGGDGQWVVIEQLSVPAIGTPVTSKMVLQAGVGYRLRASGTFFTALQTFSDAEYVDVDVGRNPVDEPAGVDVGLAVNDDTVGPTRAFKWGAFNVGHVYEVAWTGDGQKITAQIHDGNYSNNVGSLTLEILAHR